MQKKFIIQIDCSDSTRFLCDNIGGLLRDAAQAILQAYTAGPVPAVTVTEQPTAVAVEDLEASRRVWPGPRISDLEEELAALRRHQ